MIISKRALSEEQKSERRLKILDTARKLFQSKSFKNISMSEIAQKSDMAKGTVFLYFSTKEILFLNLTAQEFAVVFDALDAELISLAAIRAENEKHKKQLFIEVLQRVFEGQRIFVRLLAIQHIVLEHNITYQEARAFKLMMTGRVVNTGRLSEQVVPFFKNGDGVRFVMWIYAFAIGFFHAANPSPMIRKVYQKEPEVKKLEIDFTEQFFRAIRAVLDGMESSAKKRK
jgi:AcrR family transcriptional regulator